MIRHTTHSIEQCKGRGFDPEKVLVDVQRYQGDIERSGAAEVIVVLHVARGRIVTSEGSGDCVAAFIDPRRQTIKTVAWQRWAQVERKSQVSEWVNPVRVK